MSLEVTERWSDRSLTIDSSNNSWKATRAFDVWDPTGKMSDADVTNAVPPINDPHPDSPLLTVKTIQTKRPNPLNLAVATLTYTIAPGAGSQQTDPLKAPPQAEWLVGSRSDPLDQDIFQNSITNSAGDGFSSNTSDDVGTLFLSYQRNEPYYDVTKHQAYFNRLNNDTFTIPKAGGVQPGCARFVHYKPTQKYTFAAKYVPVEYLFELKGGNKQDSDGLWDGFKKRILDQGTRGWYTDPTSNNPARGEFFDKNGNRLSSPIALNGKGMPIDSTIQCGGYQNTFFTPYAPIANPTPLDKRIIADKSNTGAAFFLKFLTKYTASFSSLQLNAY